MNNKVNTKRYMPGLDGLRAIAVIGIIIYHLNKKWLTGGFLGVDTFFVISAYLITSLLLKEYQETGTIQLKAFWLRRVKRLIPAVFVMVGVVIVATLIFKPAEIVNIKHDAIAAVVYLSNWWYIATDVNYFDQFAFTPLKHLWSLAIEEQFYIFFPLVLVLLLIFVKKPKNITLIFWMISLISLFIMIILAGPHTGHSRVYFGTDTRLQTLLLGVILAFLWPPFRLKSRVPNGLRLGLDLIGLGSLAGLIILFFVVNDDQPWIYNGGFYLISTLTLLIIASAVLPSGGFAHLLGNRVFVYIGKRSYSLYLWHFPVISFIHSYYVSGQIPAYVYVIDILVTVVMAELSYHYVETPIRRHGLKAFSLKRQYRTPLLRTLVLLLFFVPAIFVFAGAFDSLGKEDTANKPMTFNTSEIENRIVKPIPIDDAVRDKVGLKHDKKEEPNTDLQPLMIGDSVMVDIGSEVKNKLPRAKIDGQVGRNLYDVPTIVNEHYKDYHGKSNQVVLELGTNGDFTKGQLNELIDQFGQVQIYLVTTRVPREYESHVNQLMHEAADKHDHVHVVDWYARSEGHTEYFAPDGIHLEPDGVRALTDEIVKALESQQKH